LLPAAESADVLQRSNSASFAPVVRNPILTVLAVNGQYGELCGQQLSLARANALEKASQVLFVDASCRLSSARALNRAQALWSCG
jgi:hypothetical protein